MRTLLFIAGCSVFAASGWAAPLPSAGATFSCQRSDSSYPTEGFDFPNVTLPKLEIRTGLTPSPYASVRATASGDDFLMCQTGFDYYYRANRR